MNFDDFKESFEGVRPDETPVRAPKGLVLTRFFVIKKCCPTCTNLGATGTADNLTLCDYFSPLAFLPQEYNIIAEGYWVGA